MNQRIDPSYNAEMNEHKEQITIVRHVPSLPPASGIFENDLLFNAADLCFYHELKSDADKWVWEKVTYGINRQYVIPVHLLYGDSFDFNDIVDRMETIVGWMRDRYDEMFDPLDTSDLGSTYINVIEKYNEIITYLNHICKTSFAFCEWKDLETSEKIRDFGQLYMNTLIEFLNPYFKEMEKQWLLLEGLKTANSFAEVRALAKQLQPDKEV